MATLNKNILMALLDLAQNDVQVSVEVLAQHLRYSRREVADGLNQLVLEGLVRGETCRLTFVGLMQAAGARAARERALGRGARAA